MRVVTTGRLLSAALLSVVIIAAAVAIDDAAGGAGLPVATSQPGTYVAINPSRLLDTRMGLGAPKAAVGRGGMINVQMTGRGGIPAQNVAAVAVTLAAISPTGSGSVSAWGTNSGRPATIALHLTAGRSESNQVIVPVGTGGQVAFGNDSAGAVNLVADVTGYYVGGTLTAPGATQAMRPVRLLDTRNGNGVAKARIGAHQSFSVQIAGRGGVPSTATAALVDITGLTPTAGGDLLVWPYGNGLPGITNLKFAAGQSVSNLVEVPIGSGGRIAILNSSGGTIDVAGDVEGYVLGGSSTAGGAFVPTTATRLLDTRSGLGAPTAAIAAGKSITLQVAGRGPVPATNVSAVTITLSGVSPTATGGLTAYPDGAANPGTSTTKFTAKLNSAALATVAVGADGKIVISNYSGGSVQVLGDVAGYYLADKLPVPVSTGRYVRNLTTSASDAATMHDEGCADASALPAGNPAMLLLEVGGQYLKGGVRGVQLTNTSVLIPDASLVADVNGYVDGFVGCRTSNDPAMIVVGTNNDNIARDTGAGTDWGANVIAPIASHAAGRVTIAGGNDIEPDFTGTVDEAVRWTKAYLAATTAPYVFNGAASGCPTSGAPGGTCNWGWTARNFYDLAHGLSPSRILALPQIYYPENAQQWKGIDRTGASGADRITFVGALSEYAACQTAGSGCPSGIISPTDSWNALRSALTSDAAVNQQRLPVQVDLRIDDLPGAQVQIWPMNAREPMSRS